MQEEIRTLSPAEVIRSIADGAPGMDWDLTKTLPSGERVKMPYRMELIMPDENIAILSEAQAFAQKKGELKEYGDIYKEAQVHGLLQKAMRHREKHDGPQGSFHAHVFTDADHLRRSLTETEMAALLNAYTITKGQLGALTSLDSEETEVWIERLSDELRGPFHLSQLDLPHWPGLIFHLAKVCKSLLEELGRPLSTSPPTSDSDQPDSTSTTGPSGEPATASSTDGSIELPGDRLLTREEAIEIAKRRKG